VAKANFIVANNDGFEGKKQIFALKYSEKTLTSLTRRRHGKSRF
jgi:hypothetical protein